MKQFDDKCPFRENRWRYLLSNVGNMYDIKKFDHDVASYKWWKFTDRLLKASIGKNVDDIYSKFCKEIPDRYKWMWKHYFEGKYADYKLDKRKRIKVGYVRLKY